VGERDAEHGKPERPVRVLVLQQGRVMASALQETLSASFVVALAPRLAGALMQLAADAFDVAVVDLRGRGPDDVQAVREIHACAPATEVVALIGRRAPDGAERAIELGACDVIEVPFAPPTAVRVVARAAERGRLRGEVAALHRELEGTHGFGGLLGTSAPMVKLQHELELAAGADLDVLLHGEPGTGKELAARAIHYQGARRGARFVAIHCAEVPPRLLELELFGPNRGPSAGFDEPAGVFHAARGGTVFLGDVDQLPYGLQTRLQAALQRHGVGAGGEGGGVRIVAGTRVDLLEEVRAGHFRRAFHARLGAVSIRLPALREHLEDLPALAAHFLERSARAARPGVTGFSPDGLQALLAHAWPGNVAEVEATVLGGVLACDGSTVRAADLFPEPAPSADPRPGAGPAAPAAPASGYREVVEHAVAEAAHRYLFALLTEFQGNVTQAARKAGVERETLHRLLARFGLSADSFR
jgi:DNA-binding NtrC family response regulator